MTAYIAGWNVMGYLPDHTEECVDLLEAQSYLADKLVTLAEEEEDCFLSYLCFGSSRGTGTGRGSAISSK
jgi:hypothetical protein